MSSCEPAPGVDRAAVSRIADVRSQDRVSLTGTIREAGTITFGSSPAWRCVLADDTGDLDLVFLGRSAIAGMGEGTRCSVQGTATPRQGRLTLWNPCYQVEPPAAAGLHVAAAGGDVEAAGRFRIYLGTAAGAGKTMAMLDEGHRRHQRGTDVVIALAECHHRPVTETRAAGLEAIPRQTADYRGARFEEMDTEAVLRRHPVVALVDELAHTNVPGSGRHQKRWQDVMELLEAGIDVITTVNIQHLESIADAVEQVTGVPVRERVPDWVIRRADQVELVDSSPEQLRRRMLHGNIYPAQEVPHALDHFFRADNLTALRELALRFLADETEEHLLEQLTRDPVTRSPRAPRAPWDTAERIMVGITPAPGTEAIVRRAARMANRIKAGLDIVHISSDNTGPGRDATLAGLRQLTSDVGAFWHQLSGDDPASALIEFARSGHITQIVIGSSQRSRWQELISGGSTVSHVCRLANRAGIDVHIVAQRESTAP